MVQEIVVVDAFTDRPFAGNPAAVCVLEAPADEAWMRAVAREMNLSETAFVHPESDGFRLRWLTPAVEVELCGHATLAAAHVLWEEGVLARGAEARFHTRSGVLSAVREGTLIVLDFPATFVEPCPEPPGLAAALGAEPLLLAKSRFDYLALLESETAVRELAPDFCALRALPVRGISVTARAEHGPHDIVSRFFAPGSGIDEDPVTGSAHCALGPFWAERLGKGTLCAYQASARGGTLHLTVNADRVLIGGHAVTVMRGEMYDRL